MADGLFFGLLRRREVVVPSFKGWALLLSGSALVLGCAFRSLQSFLAVERPLGGEALVVEGWIPDYALREALALFRARHYRSLIVTGGPLPPGMPYSYFGSHAALAAESLKAMGFGPDSLVVVASPLTSRDRTYLEGVSLREWMLSTRRAYAAVDVVSFSTHARRTRLLYAQALQGVSRVGIYAPADIGYDPRRWWASSIGVRSVVDETVGYLYARILFRP